MCETKKIVEELRNKKSRDNRELLDRSADMIERLAKELCDKSGCHHKCHDTTDCVVEDEAELLISNKSQCVDCIHNEICQFYKALGTTVLCYPCGFYEANNNNFDVKSNNLPSTLTNEDKVSEKYFTPSEVRKMTPKEVKENYDLIIQSMKRW